MEISMRTFMKIFNNFKEKFVEFFIHFGHGIVVLEFAGVEIFRFSYFSGTLFYENRIFLWMKIKFF